MRTMRNTAAVLVGMAALGGCLQVIGYDPGTLDTNLCTYPLPGVDAGCALDGGGATTGTMVDGATCTMDDQCASGFCVDGFCCDGACDSACQACSAALTGSTNGTCSDATSGTVDPRRICAVTAQSSCGTDGYCNAGACRDWATGTVCPSCSGGMQETGACNGSGTCTAGTATACTPYACGAMGCKTSCAAATDCIAGDFCWLGACVKVSAVSAGDAHTCALTTAGSVQCWGYNFYGELGNNSTMDSHMPVAVSGRSSGVAAISAGAGHTCALTTIITGGGVLCWGSNDAGQLGNNSTTNSTVPVAVSGLSAARAISAGGDQNCARPAEGGVLCWGSNDAGQLGDNSTTNSLLPVFVDNLFSSIVVFVAIAAGGSHTCELTATGGVLCWGWNTDGQLGNNSMTDSDVPVAVSGLSSGVLAIAAGGSHSCALTTAGGVLCWGLNTDGQLGNGTTMNSSVPVAVMGLSSGVAAITAGQSHTCALTTADSVVCWGYNDYGQLGNDFTTLTSSPVAVMGLPSGVSAISAGQLHTCALTTAGVQCWGYNGQGQLGNNTTTSGPMPVSVVEP